MPETEARLDRRTKVELFERIRREYRHGVGTIRAVAKELGVHRRMVRQALSNALPPEKKNPERAEPRLGPLKEYIDGILESDRRAPRKQRHTAHRIYIRIRQQMPDAEVSESTIRRYVARRKLEIGAWQNEVFIAQSYAFGDEAQVDWFEAYANFSGDRQKVYVFCMRSMASGAAFHCGYLHATQQAFLEAHELAFAWFGGVFRSLRYDNLSSAVKRILRGSQREETVRFIAFRSHWCFESSFCTPGEGHEKGGVEAEGGYFRRNHLTPVPEVRDLADLNDRWLAACQEDESRVIGTRVEEAGVLMIRERNHLLPLAKDGFDLAEISLATVDGNGCVTVRTNRYSTPVRPGMQVQVKVYPAYVEIWHEGRRVCRHERCYSRRQQILDLDHYLDALSRKPGALAGSTALVQWREQGRWKEVHDQLWHNLNARHGRQNGTRAMVDVIRLGREYGYERLEETIRKALELGCSDVEAVRYLLLSDGLGRKSPESIDASAFAQYERPMPTLTNYDTLLSGIEAVA
jgi:transposase